MFHLREEEEVSSAKRKNASPEGKRKQVWVVSRQRNTEETKVGRHPNPPDSEETPSSPSSITPPIDRTSPPANTQDPPIASISGSSTRTPFPERGEDEETGSNHGDTHTSRTQCYRGEKNGFPANNEGSHRHRRYEFGMVVDIGDGFLGILPWLCVSLLLPALSPSLDVLTVFSQFVVQGFGSWVLLFVEVCKLNGKSSSSSIWFSVVSCASSECVPEQFKELQSLP
ncbi:hypothetical protein F2Q70_00031526 [Brassica cretica]|uniref:Uncharacterized protein n=1 Tax=Brassica cretica TaxID=69181 RepID=A0A3N6QRM6_BRACR|nr:hypothetical protein F2Q70_00031526 [Brassica cretica]KAF3592241.1 hypothetical protein DY000_02024782 [Brassica cretica]